MPEWFSQYKREWIAGILLILAIGGIWVAKHGHGAGIRVGSSTLSQQSAKGWMKAALIEAGGLGGCPEDKQQFVCQQEMQNAQRQALQQVIAGVWAEKEIQKQRIKVLSLIHI